MAQNVVEEAQLSGDPERLLAGTAVFCQTNLISESMISGCGSDFVNVLKRCGSASGNKEGLA